jgi:hypothetical protein
MIQNDDREDKTQLSPMLPSLGKLCAPSRDGNPSSH